jgi:hypothetical protein
MLCIECVTTDPKGKAICKSCYDRFYGQVD